MLLLRGRGRVPALWVFTVNSFTKLEDGENPPSEPVQQSAEQNALESCSGTGANALWEGVTGVSENRWWGVDVSHVVGWPCLTLESSMSEFQFCTAPPWGLSP